MQTTPPERPRQSLVRRLLAAIIYGADREEPYHPRYPDMTMHGLHDPEIGGLSSGSADVPQLARRLTVATTHPSTLIPPSDKLLVFRALTGIDSVPALEVPHHHHRTARNVGIYTRVVRAEQVAAQRHHFFSILMNSCLGIQIVVAAALTALGAASGPHNAVTAFGAINTIMAGVLTYLKGSGLPDRLKHYQNEWRNIREYIEQREREFCLDGCRLNVQEEILFIERMYEGIKREIEATKAGENRSTAEPGHFRRSFLPEEPESQQHHHGQYPGQYPGQHPGAPGYQQPREPEWRQPTAPGSQHPRGPEVQHPRAPEWQPPRKPDASSPVSIPGPVLEKTSHFERP